MGAQRRQAWYVEEGAERPVLLEVIRLYRAGLSSLDARPLELPLMSQAAVLLTGLSPRERQFRLISALLDALFDPDSDRWIKGAFHRNVGSLLLGHHDDTHGSLYDDRRDTVASLYNRGADWFRNAARGGEEAPMIRRITSAIEKILNHYGSTGQRRPRETSTLIERESCVKDLLALMQAGARLIYIWGEPGTGKTVLADQVARRLAGDDGLVVILRSGNPDVLEADVTEALMAEGMEPTNWTGAYCRAALKRRLTTGGELPRCSCVVIDNIGDEGLLHQIIPEEPAVPVLVTMRSKPTNQSNGLLELHDFSEEQACAFLRDHLKQASDDQILSLARALGHRPLALDHAVRFVKESPDVGLADLVDALATSVTTGLTLVESGMRARTSLVEMYRLILADITKHEEAVLVLDGFLGITGMSGLVGPELLRYFMASEAGGSIEGLQFAAGVSFLSTYGVLRIKKDETFPFSNGFDLSMHALTFEILRELRVATLGNIEAAYLSFLQTEDHGHEGMNESSIAGSTSADVKGALLDVIDHSRMPESWLLIHRLDDRTWTAIRHAESSEEYPFDYYPARYDVYPHGVYETDYRTDTRRILSDEEMVALALAARCYFEAEAFMNQVMAGAISRIKEGGQFDGKDLARMTRQAHAARLQ